MARVADLGKGSKFVILASICIVIAGLRLASEVFIPLALAILVTFLLAPIVDRMERLRVPRTLAVLTAVVLGLCLVAFLAYVVLTQVIDVAKQIPVYRDQIQEKVIRIRGSTGGIGRMAGAVQNTFDVKPATQPTTAAATQPAAKTAVSPAMQATTSVESAIGGSSTPAAAAQKPGEPALPNVNADNPLPVRVFPETSPVSMLMQYVGTALSPLATAFLVVVFVIFMLLKREDLRDRMIRLVGAGRLNVTTQAASDAAARISRYLVAQALVNLSYGCCVAVGLFVIGRTLGRAEGGFPNVLLWGLVCGVFRFVPYVGTWIGAALPIALSFGFFRSNSVFFATAGMFVGIEVVISQAVEPMLYGSSTGMSAVAVLAAAVFWTWVWGPIGLLLSTPLTVVLVVLGKYVPQLQFLDILLGDEPVLEPPVRVYQRLLALDQEEAADVARGFFEELGLMKVFDQVLLPALALAEVDHHNDRLDDRRRAFVRSSIRDIIEEVAELATAKRGADQARQLKDDAAQTVADAKGGPVAAASQAAAVRARPVRHVPEGCDVNVMCLPARDETDEIAALMLSRVLEERGYCPMTISQSALASEMVDAVKARGVRIVVVSALPPAAVSHARYICKRLEARSDDLNMVVGLWCAKGDLKRAKERLASPRNAVVVTTTLEQSVEQIGQYAHPLIVASVNDAGNKGTDAKQKEKREPAVNEPAATAK